MHLSHPQSAGMGSPNTESEARTHSRGTWLVLARLAWAGMAGFTLLLFVLGLPVRYEHLHNLSAGDALPNYMTPAAMRAALAQLGLSVDFRAVFFLAVAIALALGSLVVAIVIIWRKSDDGLALFVSLFLLTLGTWPTGVVPALVISHPEWSLSARFVSAFTMISLLLFCFLFPDGRFVPSFTRVVALLWSLFMLYWTMANPDPGLVAQLLLVVGLGTGAFAQVYRYRRVSGPVERQQTKWVVFGVTWLVLAFPVLVGLLPALVPVFSQASALRELYEMVGLGIVLFGAFLFVPLSVGIALLRYRLWDIDVLINRTLVYSTLTISLTAVYLGLVIGLSALLRGIISQDNSVAIVISTLVAFFIAQPLRKRLQAVIDRRFYRRKYDAAKTMAVFSAMLRQEVDLDQLREELLAVVQQTMQPAHVSLWLRPPQRTGTQQAGWHSHAPASLQQK